jgi:LAGLIDADG endonuclease
MITTEYIAGFFDGEGCVDFKITGQARMIAVRASIINTNRELLNLIQLEFGGSIYSRPNAKNPHWKHFNSLTWINSDAVKFLRLIKPHIIIKLTQIRLAEEYWEWSQSPRENRCQILKTICKNGIARPRWIRTSETLAQEKRFKERMHILNMRGL